MDKKKKTFPVSIILIIIVLTIVILGLGLTLIIGYLTQVPSATIKNPIPDYGVPDATIKNPISTASDTFTIEKGRVYPFIAEFYNSHNDETIVTFSLGDCFVADTLRPGTDYFSLIFINKSVAIGSTNSFKMNLKTKPNTSSGEYICDLLAIDSTNDPSGKNPLEQKMMVFKVK